MGEIIARAVRAAIITFIGLWFASNILKLVFDFWFLFNVIVILMFVLGL